MTDQPLATPQGQIDKEALRARINAALSDTERVECAIASHRLTVRREGGAVRVACWCGKARLLSVEHINVFCKQFNDFLYEHSWCEPGDAA